MTGGAGHFCRPLHVAMQIGPYLPARSASGSGVWSLRIPRGVATGARHSGNGRRTHSLMVPGCRSLGCGCRAWGAPPDDSGGDALDPTVFPAGCPHRSHCHQPLMMSGRVAPDTRAFQHIARFYNGLRRSSAPACAGWDVARLTVRVTAAVHRGFSSQLAPLPLTFRHWAGVSLYT